jgi:hypothetical protein
LCVQKFRDKSPTGDFCQSLLPPKLEMIEMELNNEWCRR